jgi:hypothetical protein
MAPVELSFEKGISIIMDQSIIQMGRVLIVVSQVLITTRKNQVVVGVIGWK